MEVLKVNNTNDTNRQSSGVFYGWWVVFASILGIAIGPGQFAFGSLGLVMIPLNEEFGWSRAQISFALTVFTVLIAISVPIVGALVDRLGSRRVLIPSVVIFGTLLGLIGLSVSELWHLWVVFALIGTLAAGANSLCYMTTISTWFDKRRGLAIGLTMMGAGLGYVYVPLVVTFMTENFGWRTAFYALAITVYMIVPILWLLFRNSPSEIGLQPDGMVQDARDHVAFEKLGINRREAIGQPLFWLLFLIFAVLSFSVFGILPHLVPMLVDRGMESGSAATIAASVGLSSLFARAINGYLIDYFFAPRIAFVCFLVCGTGIGILASGASEFPVVMLAAFLLGFAMGAEMDLLAYLGGRYFGLRNFGQIYGVLFIALMVGTSIGPVSYGYAFDQFGSYVGVLTVCTVVNLCISFTTFSLPRFPDFSMKGGQ